MHLQHGLHAGSLMFPWQPVLNGYHKATLTIVRGKTRHTLSVFDISHTHTLVVSETKPENVITFS